MLERIPTQVKGHRQEPRPLRIGVVLSAGGLRGVAHLGILRRLLQHGIPLDVLVGVSAGAIIAGFYAGAGLSIDEMIREARTFRGRHIIMHGLLLRAPEGLRTRLKRLCGVIPERLRQLDEARFDRLHFNVKALGIVCHDLLCNRPVYFDSVSRQEATLAEVVKASASIPGVIPSQVMQRGGQEFRLVDGGLSDSLPVEFACSPGLGATHLIVCDCRRGVPSLPTGENRVYIRPQLNGMGILRSPRASLLEGVRQGEAAVTDEVLQTIRNWGLSVR